MKIKTIGVLTSGGDAPGMNAAIRAVTRAGISNGFKIKGIFRGYDGLINNEIKDFTTENVSGIINRGGTILRTARSSEFETPEGRKKAYENMRSNNIDALVVIGGNGSLTGAKIFAEEYEQSTMTCMEPIPQSATTRHSTQLWNVWIESEIPPLAMSVSSLLKSWGAMLASWLRTAQSQVGQRQPSFLKTQRMSTSWHVSWSVESERASVAA